MTHASSSVDHLSNQDLLAEVRRLARRERHATAHLIASLAELDTRRLYLGEGCSSLFTYCTQVLHLSEHAAYHRIEAARATRRFPAILELLAEGSVTLTTVGLLARHLTPENHHELLDAARHRSKREVEHLIARLHPRLPVASSVRRLPEPKAAGPEAGMSASAGLFATPVSVAPRASVSAPRLPVVTPLAPATYKVQFTVGAETHAKLRRAQELMRHSIPNGDPAEIFDRALTVLLEQIERSKCGAAQRPARVRRPTAPGSRHIPAAVRRAVWERDGGRCAFMGAAGRCTERGFLEFHHVVPFASGGAATVENIQVRCRRHNLHDAEEHFGPWVLRERGTGYLIQLGPDRVAASPHSSRPRMSAGILGRSCG